MNVYTCVGFKGHWPVGTSAVVVASNRLSAAQALEASLKAQGLEQTIETHQMKLLDLSHRHVVILTDGNY